MPPILRPLSSCQNLAYQRLDMEDLWFCRKSETPKKAKVGQQGIGRRRPWIPKVSSHYLLFPFTHPSRKLYAHIQLPSPKWLRLLKIHKAKDTLTCYTFFAVVVRLKLQQLVRKKKEEAAALKALKEKAGSKGGFAKVKGSKWEAINCTRWDTQLLQQLWQTLY